LDKKVLYKFYARKALDKLPVKFHPKTETTLKCGTPAISDFQNNKSKLSASSVSEVESMMESPQTQASETYQSPSGKFTIHYETSGADAVPGEDSDGDGVPDYVEWTAAAADSSWRHEVVNLGYSDPIFGSSDPYKIYIEVPFFGPTTYGETHVGSYKSVNDPTIIVINNQLDDPGFHSNTDDNPTRGAIKVTVAHEFKHAVQYTASQWSGETSNWLEMDATLMEEVVYDNVNDYYNYLESEESIFKNPQTSFYPGSYYHVSWALFFEEKFGSDFWPQVWEIIKDNPSITMVDALTQQLGGANAFRRAYTESQLWHYASGPQNSSFDYGFEESENYPSPNVDTSEELFTKSFAIPRPSPLSTFSSFSARYYDIPISESENIQGNIMVEITSSGVKKELGIIAYYQDGTVKSFTSLVSNNESPFKMSDLDWDNVDKLGLVLANSSTASSDEENDQTIVGVGTDTPENAELNHNYPNPFNPQTRIRFTVDQTSHVELKVYDSAGRLITTLINEELAPGVYEPVFDGSNLASGIYFYQMVTDHQAHTQQMTLIK
jgi:hypothetical protein